MAKKLRIKIIKPRITKYCICPVCGLKQTFKKKSEHWKTVKEFDLDKPVLLKVLVVSAKCLNPHCKAKSFPLPVKGITKYQRATNRVIKEGVLSNILNNIPAEKIRGRLARSFNVTGSRRTLDRWKHKEADKLNFKDLTSLLVIYISTFFIKCHTHVPLSKEITSFALPEKKRGSFRLALSSK